MKKQRNVENIKAFTNIHHKKLKSNKKYILILAGHLILESDMMTESTLFTPF